MFFRILSVLSPRERRGAFLVLLAAIVSTIVEVVGIGAVAAFIAAVADPAALAGNRWLAGLRAQSGLEDPRSFYLAAGIALFAVFVFRNLFGIFVLWYRLRFLHGTKRAMTTRLLAYYLSRPYEYFLNVNSAQMAKNVTLEVNAMINGCLYSWIMLISDAVMAIAVIGLLFWYDPALTAVALMSVGGLMALVPLVMRRRLGPLGVEYRALTEGLFKTTNEAIGGIKEIKVLNRETFFSRMFERIAQSYARVTIRYMMLTDTPRYVLEVLVVGGILATVLVAVSTSASYAAFAGTVTLFAAAAYRLMPIGHRMLSSIAGLQFNAAILDALVEGLKPLPEGALARPVAPLPFERQIRFRAVTFRYAAAAQATLGDLSFDVPCNASVAFVGPTGVGKTTVVDVLAGLLVPSSGAIEIDGVALGDEETRRRWQANIGYVPQQVFLLDDTIRRNIAVGVPDDEIDEAALRRAAAMAHVDEFVSKLPEGYETTIGERGIRLSGGQRQRLGIARALYRRAKVLILDEATSALDGIAESIIEQAIADLAGQVTIVIVAHRLTTVRRCDAIHLMEAGRIVASGTYDALMRDNATFRAMARAVA